MHFTFAEARCQWSHWLVIETRQIWGVEPLWTPDIFLVCEHLIIALWLLLSGSHEICRKPTSGQSTTPRKATGRTWSASCFMWTLAVALFQALPYVNESRTGWGQGRGYSCSSLVPGSPTREREQGRVGPGTRLLLQHFSMHTIRMLLSYPDPPSTLQDIVTFPDPRFLSRGGSGNEAMCMSVEGSRVQFWVCCCLLV